MIELIPAIDLINGQCVRLEQGDFTRAVEYAADPVAMARVFEQSGFRRLHLVDLDGARKGQVIHYQVLKDITAATSLEVDYSGGIKTASEVQQVLDSGAEWLGIGSMALTQAATFRQWLKSYGSHLFLLGADVSGEQLVINGWQQQTQIQVYDFIGSYYELGLRRFFCTDISKDGMLSGPSVNLYRQLLHWFPDLYLIASGGVRSAADIAELEQAGCSGVIIGKALYEGRIRTRELQQWL